jgi:3-methyl-2-oxobutanoate hydroxymethyltransferase
MVARGSSRALRVVDMPFMSYTTPDQAIDSAARLMREGGAQMVKLEGGAVQLGTVRHLTAHGVPVCAHLGLIPQSVHQLGGYLVQGRDAADAQRLLDDARALEQAGAGLLVLECIPAELARGITGALTIPTIGIGAGPHCDGQVLVLNDMLGITGGKRPRFVKDFLAGRGDIRAAIAEYVRAVKAGEFPAPEHSY